MKRIGLAVCLILVVFLGACVDINMSMTGPENSARSDSVPKSTDSSAFVQLPPFASRDLGISPSYYSYSSDLVFYTPSNFTPDVEVASSSPKIIEVSGDVSMVIDPASGRHLWTIRVIYRALDIGTAIIKVSLKNVPNQSSSFTVTSSYGGGKG